MRRPSSWFLAALVLFSAALPLAAQKVQAKNIVFKGVPEYSEEELLAASGLKKGATLTAAEMNDHLKLLVDSGVFGSLKYSFDGANLVYTMTPAATLYPIRLENLPLAPGKDLDAKLHDRFPLYHGKVPSEGGLLENVRSALEQLLAAQGINATVTVLPYSAPGAKDVSAMDFAIESPPVRVGEIHLEGVSPEMQAKAKSVADLAGKADFNTESSAGNLEHALSLFYSEEGYSSVKVHAEQSGNPIVAGDAVEIPFKLTIVEGRHYALGTIRLPSGELLTLADINKAAGVTSTSLETLSIKGGVTLRTALLYVTGECKSKGYMECVITPHPQYDDANSVVNYTFEIQTGPAYTMGNLKIDNVSDDLRAAMLAAWKLPAGAVFSEKAIRDYFSSQGNKTPLGRTFAALNCRYKLAANPETHIVDVTLTLERKQ
jgi:outer membrane protein assembly factor BamA